jgi:hypothetical protein
MVVFQRKPDLETQTSEDNECGYHAARSAMKVSAHGFILKSINGLWSSAWERLAQSRRGSQASHALPSVRG